MNSMEQISLTYRILGYYRSTSPCELTINRFFMLTVSLIVLLSHFKLCNTSQDFDIIANMDQSVNPCDDFYRYACGGFLNKTSIPHNQELVDGITITTDQVEIQLKHIIEKPILFHEPKFIKLTKNFYNSCMSVDTLQTKGHNPLLNVLEELGGWPVLLGNKWNETNFNWIESIYKLRDMGYPINYFINFNILCDLKNNTKQIIHVGQPQLGLSREYFMEEVDKKMIQLYYEYMVDIAVLLGANRKTARIELDMSLKFEKTLANMSLPKEELRNITKIYNPMNLTELSQTYPSIPWKEYFNRLLAPEASVEDNEIVNVNAPSYISKFVAFIQKVPRRTQANYVMWRIVQESIEHLNIIFRKRQLKYSSQISGKSEEGPRWKKCISTVVEKLPVSVGAMYVRNYFNDSGKQNVIEMVDDIKNELNIILEQVEWMDNYTRNNALNKSYAMTSNVAYPDELFDNNKLEEFYTGLELNDSNYLHSILNVTRFDIGRKFRELKMPIDKKKWHDYGASAEVNAFYSYIENSIRLPAAILQDRFFGNNRPKYMNYGVIGWIIGHEMTHAFDDIGQHFDKNGNLENWWTSSTKEKYSRKIKCITNQYNNYTVPEVGLHLNGMSTLNENIADNGGIKVAYLAYKQWMMKNGRETSIHGIKFTPEQLFWISAANLHCCKIRPKYLKQQIITNNHNPGEFRLLGSFSNMIDFAKDFKCPIRSRMNPEIKCAVW